MNGDFQPWLARFFESYYRHRPVNATFVGEHGFDHLLPDFSAASVAALASDMARLLEEAATLDTATLSPVERIDKRLAEGFLRIQQWELGSQHFQRGNPSLYTGEAIFGVIGLFLTDFAPFAERAEAAVARIGATSPHQARANSNRPMPTSRKLARSSASRAASSNSGRHSARLVRAASRRSGSRRSASPPVAAPSARCRPQGSRASAMHRPTPSHTGQWRGASEGRSGGVVLMP